MSLLRVVAAVMFVFAVLEAQGWLVDQSAPHSLAFIGVGLLTWVVSTFPVPDVPASR
jgi:hypothetical protein